MTRVGLFSIASVLLAFGTLVSGCSHDDPASGTTDQQTVVASTIPQDGASGVPTSSPFVMTFSMPMDTMSVIEHFHCAGGDEMWEWMDSLQHYHTGMGGHMIDMDHMMAWMNEIELRGRFHWNNDMTECIFRPDADFLPHTDHMVYLENGIRSRDGHMMDGMDLRYKGLMIHFRTGP